MSTSCKKYKKITVQLSVRCIYAVTARVVFLSEIEQKIKWNTREVTLFHYI